MPLKSSHKRRLPLYGPLDIQDSILFLNESKETFNKHFLSPFPYKVKMDNFEMIRVLGEGAFGKVLLAHYKIFEKSYYAVKALQKKNLVKKNMVKHALNEKRVLQNLNCPFCVRMEYFSQDNSYIYFFMPFISGGELFTHLRNKIRFPEPVSVFYASQVVLALEYIHYVGMIYRDLKPENILIDHLGYLRITDFGFAKRVSDRTYTFCGTSDYISPEVIQCKGYGKTVDWWALGVLIFEMSLGQPPFSGKTEIEKYYKILRGKFDMPRPFSANLQDLIKNLLETDLTKRYGNLKGGSNDIKTHPWFKGIDWSILLNRRVVPPYIPSARKSSAVNKLLSLPKKSFDIRVSEIDHYEGVFDDF